MSGNLNEEKQEFKLSFKPSSSLNMSNNNNSNNHSNNNHGSQWMSSSSTSNNISNSFLNQSPSSILLSSFNDNSNNSNNSNNNNNNNNNSTTSNMSMFNPMKNLNINDNNNNILNTSHSHLPTDTEVIFHKSVPIMIKSSMIESNTRQLTLKIEKIIQLPQNQQILSITLTDEVKLYYLVFFLCGTIKNLKKIYIYIKIGRSIFLI